MRALVLLFLTAYTSFLSGNKADSSVNFFKGSFKNAQLKAKNEGKYFFVDFYANWCAPCKWMEETTFNDQRVKSKLEENFVSFKLNIDEAEGFEMKQKYQVRYLPTFLIFDENGNLIRRVEETLSPSKLLEILESINPSEQIETKPLNTSPNRNYVSNSGKLFRVQVGSYVDYKQTFKQVEELREVFIDPVIVLNDYSNGSVQYNVMIGEFPSSDLASDFAAILREDYNLNATVK